MLSDITEESDLLSSKDESVQGSSFGLIIIDSDSFGGLQVDNQVYKLCMDIKLKSDIGTKLINLCSHSYKRHKSLSKAKYQEKGVKDRDKKIEYELIDYHL